MPQMATRLISKTLPTPTATQQAAAATTTTIRTSRNRTIQVISSLSAL